MFIELTLYSTKQRISVNINQITDYFERKSGTSIQLDGNAEGSFVSVNESYEQVQKLIENEVAAERGYTR